MKELVRVVETPRTCSYLPEESAALEYRLIDGLTSSGYSQLLARGYRRFGHQLFRPACPSCRKCISLRVLAQERQLRRGQRRNLKRNSHIRAELHPLFVTRRHLSLYESYHSDMARRRGWPPSKYNAQEYIESFILGGGEFGRQWLFFDADRLVGVALMDQVEDAVSLVYFFHEPEWRRDGPGTYSALTQIEYARRSGRTHAYLGYWIAANQSMAYKHRFEPHELLDGYPEDLEEPVWRRAGSHPDGEQGVERVSGKDGRVGIRGWESGDCAECDGA